MSFLDGRGSELVLEAARAQGAFGGEYVMSACGKVAGFRRDLLSRMGERGMDVTCGLCRRFLYGGPAPRETE